MHTSHTEAEADIAVLGAGPAGATAARLLGSWGHSVLLIGRPPGRRTLAESLPPSCAKLFDKLGIRDAIDAAPFIRATGNTVRWAGGDTRVEQFEAGLGYQISRDAFDSLLNDLAAHSRGLRRIDAGARAVVRESGTDIRWRVEVDDEQSITARWVLDCTGRTGVVARHGWRRAETTAKTIAIVGVWERPGGWPIADPTHTLVESYRGGWAWSVPVSESRRYMTLMLDPTVTMLPDRVGLADGYMDELSRTEMIRELVAGASLVDQPWAVHASPYGADRVCGDGVLLVGDAASFVDPLSSFGVKKALASAWLASVAVHTSIGDSSMTTAALGLFANRERAMYDELQRRSAALSREAMAAHPTSFWSSRAIDADEPNVATYDDGRIRAAFDALKERENVRFALGDGVELVDEAVVQGNRVVLEPHIAAPGLVGRTRYYRNANLVAIATLSPDFDQVGDVYAAYCRSYGQLPLPDFLAALSLLVAYGVLVVG